MTKAEKIVAAGRHRGSARPQLRLLALNFLAHWASGATLRPGRRSLAFALAFLAAAAAAAVARAKRSLRGPKMEWLIKRLAGSIICRLLPIPEPRVVTGAGTVGRIGDILREQRCCKPLIVTDEALVRQGLARRCSEALAASGMASEVYSAVVPNPPAEVVEAGHALYESAGCDAIIALGGGSPMDTAKVIGAKVANPRHCVSAYEGFLNVTWLGLRPLPPLIAVPTTAGTGSEATICAVITKGDKKVIICDEGLVPRVAILDPEILVKLPRALTAATGIDALTHAIEAFLAGWASDYVKERSERAVQRIFRSILTTYHDGTNLLAREDMLVASLEAGLAFTRASIGYVHAIAHQLGGIFHTPHGDANAMLLPHILSFYLAAEERDSIPGRPCAEKLCLLAISAGCACAPLPEDGAGRLAVAWNFVDRVAAMCLEMGLPTDVPKMKAADVPTVARRALGEAHGEQHPLAKVKARVLDLGYPVPVYMTLAECQEIVAKVLPPSERDIWQGVRRIPSTPSLSCVRGARRVHQRRPAHSSATRV